MGALIALLIVFVLVLVAFFVGKKNDKRKKNEEEELEKKREAERVRKEFIEQQERIRKEKELADSRLRLEKIEKDKIAREKLQEELLLKKEQKRQEELLELRRKEAEEKKRLEKLREERELARIREEEKKRIEDLLYENINVVFCYLDITNAPNALVKRNNNTYSILKNTPNSTPFKIGVMRVLKTNTAAWFWFDEKDYEIQKNKLEEDEKKAVKYRQEEEKRKQEEEKRKREQIQRELEEKIRKAELKKQEERKKILAPRERKANWQQYANVLKNHGITELYHFTDRSNIESIKKNGGLFSWEYSSDNGISVPRAGGGSLSRDLDRKYNLQDYVRLTFTRNHPMMYVAQKDGRISDPVILVINLEPCYWEGTKFSNMNATRNGHTCGSALSNLENIHFNTVKQSSQFNLSEIEKPYYQAEVLVKTCIPIEYISNIHNF